MNNEYENISKNNIEELDSKKLNSLNVGKTIATKIPLNMYDEVMFLIENGAYLSISDFLRESIRGELKNYKVSRVKNLDYSDAKREVLSYFIQYGEAYIDDLALSLGIDFKIIFNILKDLINEGRIKRDELENEFKEIDFNSDVLNLDSRRLIVEARDVIGEYIKLDSIEEVNIKKRGYILKNGVAIISNHYIFIK